MSELGQALRDAREAKGLSLDDLQEETKIQKRYLLAIEEGDFKRLPGAFYSRAFIKNYAEAVGLNFGELADEFADEMPEMEHSQSEIHTIPPRGGEEVPAAKAVRRSRTRANRWSSFLNTAIVTVIILIVLAMIYILAANFMGGGSGESRQNNNSSVSFAGSSDTAGGADKTSDVSKKQPSTSSGASSKKQTLKLEGTQGTTSTYTLSGAEKFVIDIAAKNGQPTWIQATDQENGKVLQEVTASEKEGRTLHLDASSVRSLRLQIGSVPNTSMKINGETFKFSNQSIVQTLIINYKK
ncbi:helix-turn-helix domain-containing protein [Sporolactobacillus sp. THM7-7]|nr:helix-turn-helix domain-containing protein [Sporolactobacillus sp. THM7-7]